MVLSKTVELPLLQWRMGNIKNLDTLIGYFIDLPEHHVPDQVFPRSSFPKEFIVATVAASDHWRSLSIIARDFFKSMCVSATLIRRRQGVASPKHFWSICGGFNSLAWILFTCTGRDYAPLHFKTYLNAETPLITS